MKTEICAGGFVCKKDRFLFGKRSKKKSWAPGLWDIAGGHAKEDEKPTDTLKREILEEIGIHVINAELMTVLDVPDESLNRTFKYYIYMITDYTGKPENCSKEHTKIRWFKRNKLDEIALALPEYTELIDTWMNSTETSNI